jgi:hypothetical protein
MDAAGIFALVETHCATTGWFDRVAGHEPKNAPGNGMTAAIWLRTLQPDPEQSGLAATTPRLTLNIRLYSPMLAEPQDGIDPGIVSAAHAVMAAISADYTLGGLVRNVDLLGMSASGGMGGEAGYLNQDGKLYRVVVITVPMILLDTDAWSQSG